MIVSENSKFGFEASVRHIHLFSDCLSHVILECRCTKRTPHDFSSLPRKVVWQPFFFVSLACEIFNERKDDRERNEHKKISVEIIKSYDRMIRINLNLN